MKFEEVIDALRKGKQVRRECWHRADSITYDWGGDLSKLCEIPHGGYFQYQLPLEDLNADDWEIKGEDWKPKSKGEFRDMMEEIECEPETAKEREENVRRTV